MNIEDYGARFAVDARALDDLRLKARNDPGAALKGAARQFEAYFMQSLLKSMRATLSQDTPFDNEQTRFYTSLHDQQLAQSLAGTGALGLAKILEAQLSRNAPTAGDDSVAKPAPGAEAAAPQGSPAPAARLAPVQTAVGHLPGAQGTPALVASPTAAVAATPPVAAGASDSRAFVDRIWPDALAASEVSGLPPTLIVAHAALESGWGKSEIRRADGTPSFNLFGIKAGKSWRGEVAEASTTEFENGQPTRRVEKFRAYGSYREAFIDYANLLAGSPRFSAVVAAGNGADFADALQQSGYATDPMYAAKLSRILQGKTLRDALQG